MMKVKRGMKVHWRVVLALPQARKVLATRLRALAPGAQNILSE